MKIAATAFKANCLKLMSRVSRTHRPVVITKRGVPVAQLIPAQAEPESLYGYMQGTVTVKGDVVSSLQETWSVMDGDEDDLYAVVKKRPSRKRKQS